MKNIFKLKGEELKEYQKNINLISKYFNYIGYKWFFDIVTKETINLNDIEGVLTLDRPRAFAFGEEDMSHDEWSAYIDIYEFITNTFYNELPKYYEVRNIDTYDKQFPNNPYYFGYKICDGERNLCFYDGYTGVAGCHWEALAFHYWFEELN